MPVGSTTKTEWEMQAKTAYLLDPDTGEPVGSASLPVTIVDGWEIETLALEGANDTNKHVTVPANTLYQVLWVWVELASSAVVGNRQIAVEIQDAANDVIGQIRVGAVQAASLTRYYMLAPALADHLAFRDTDYLMTPMPPTLILSAGQHLRIFDQNIIDVNADDMVVQIQIAKRAA